MKINITSLVIIAFFLSGCNSVQPEVTSTFTPVSTKIIQPIETPTLLSTSTTLPTSAKIEITAISHGNQIIIKGIHTTVRWLFWSKDSKRLFIGTQFNGVLIYDMVNNKMSAHFESDSIIMGLALSPDESVFAVATDAESIRLIDSETGELIRTLHISYYWPSTLNFSPDGKILASYNDRYKETILWDVATGEEIKRLENSGGRQFFSLDGKSFTTSSPSPDGAFRVWNTNTWKIQETIRCKILGVSSFSPDKNRFTRVDTETKEVSIWDFKSCEKLFNLNGSQIEPFSIAYDVNNELIAAGNYSGGQKISNVVTIWDANTGKHLSDLITGYYGMSIFPTAFNVDGSKLVTAAQDEGGGIVIIWDLTQQ